MTQGCAQLVGSYKVVQKVHCVCASLSGAPFGGLMYKVFSDREIHTLCFLYNYVLAFYMFVRACLSQLGGLMCKQRATVFVSQYLS